MAMTCQDIFCAKLHKFFLHRFSTISSRLEMHYLVNRSQGEEVQSKKKLFTAWHSDVHHVQTRGQAGVIHSLLSHMQATVFCPGVQTNSLSLCSLLSLANTAGLPRCKSCILTVPGGFTAEWWPIVGKQCWKFSHRVRSSCWQTIKIQNAEVVNSFNPLNYELVWGYQFITLHPLAANRAVMLWQTNKGT